MVIFHCYVSLPEGTAHRLHLKQQNVLVAFCRATVLDALGSIPGPLVGGDWNNEWMIYPCHIVRMYGMSSFPLINSNI